MPVQSEPRVFLIPEGVLAVTIRALRASVPQYSLGEGLDLVAALAALPEAPEAAEPVAVRQGEEG